MIFGKILNISRTGSFLVVPFDRDYIVECTPSTLISIFQEMISSTVDLSRVTFFSDISFTWTVTTNLRILIGLRTF